MPSGLACVSRKGADRSQAGVATVARRNGCYRGGRSKRDPEPCGASKDPNPCEYGGSRWWVRDFVHDTLSGDDDTIPVLTAVNVHPRLAFKPPHAFRVEAMAWETRQARYYWRTKSPGNLYVRAFYSSPRREWYRNTSSSPWKTPSGR